MLTVSQNEVTPIDLPKIHPPSKTVEMNRIQHSGVFQGLVIGIANLLWLYLAYYLGLHTSSMANFQFFMLGWLILNIVLYWWALRSMKRRCASFHYLAGFKGGAVASLVSAFIAVIAQVGYFKVVHPEWPEFMVERSREHFESAGVTPEELESKLEQARVSFSLQTYAIQSAITALVLGVALTAIMMLFLRDRRQSA